MSAKAAEIDIVWYLENAETDACGLRASAANNVEEQKHGAPSGGGGSTRGYQPRDYYPERSEADRGRLLRVAAVMHELSAGDHAVLHARYLPRSRHQRTVPGLGELTWVGELLEVVRRRAAEQRVTPQEALRDLAGKAKDRALRDDCEALVHAALERYAAVAARKKAEAQDARLARLARAADADPIEWAEPDDADGNVVRLASGARLA